MLIVKAQFDNYFVVFIFDVNVYDMLELNLSTADERGPVANPTTYKRTNNHD